MIQQINNNSIRDTEMHESDIDFLRKFYVEHSHFPVFQQVLIETRTDCNNHCPFCPHAFNKKTLGIMKWKCYTTIIDQLCEINYNGRVALMLSNEPLLDDSKGSAASGRVSVLPVKRAAAPLSCLRFRSGASGVYRMQTDQSGTGSGDDTGKRI